MYGSWHSGCALYLSFIPFLRCSGQRWPSLYKLKGCTPTWKDSRWQHEKWFSSCFPPWVCHPVSMGHSLLFFSLLPSTVLGGWKTSFSTSFFFTSGGKHACFLLVVDGQGSSVTWIEKQSTTSSYWWVPSFFRAGNLKLETFLRTRDWKKGMPHSVALTPAMVGSFTLIPLLPKMLGS